MKASNLRDDANEVLLLTAPVYSPERVSRPLHREKAEEQAEEPNQIPFDTLD